MPNENHRCQTRANRDKNHRQNIVCVGSKLILACPFDINF